MQFFGQIRLIFDPGEPPRGGVKIQNYLKLIASAFTHCTKLLKSVLKSIEGVCKVKFQKIAYLLLFSIVFYRKTSKIKESVLVV